MKIFISYRRQDGIAYALTLIRDKLEEEFGEGSVFYDLDSIPLGIDFRHHLDCEIQNADLVLAFIGDSWLGQSSSEFRRIDDPDDFVRIEIESALKRKIPIVPVFTDTATTALLCNLPASIEELRFRNEWELRKGRVFDGQLAQMIKRLVRQAEANRDDSGDSVIRAEPASAWTLAGSQGATLSMSQNSPETIPAASVYQELEQTESARENMLRHWWTSIVGLDQTGRFKLTDGCKYSFIRANSMIKRVSYIYAVKRFENALELYIDVGSAEENMSFLKRLEESKEEVESHAGYKLEWDRIDGKRATRVRFKMEGGYDSPQSQWPDIHAKATTIMKRFMDALDSVLKKWI